MSDFKDRYFEGETVLWAVRWYYRYGVSCRDLEQMMGERGVVVDHSTIYRWVQRYAPERAGAVGMQRRMGQGNLAEGLIAPTIERNVTLDRITAMLDWPALEARLRVTPQNGQNSTVGRLSF